MGDRSSVRAAVDATSGAVAGAVSRTVLAPLDVIKIRFQVQLEPTSIRLASKSRAYKVSKYTGVVQAIYAIFREEGVKGLWRGNVPALLMTMPYTAIQFAVFHRFKELAMKISGKGKPTPVISFTSGAIAGSAATLGSYPFDVLRTILASQGEPQVYTSMRSAFLDVFRSRGVKGLYAGLTPALIEIVPYAGLQFGFYDTFKSWAQTWNSRSLEKHANAAELSGLQQFLCGLAAGTLAKVCCHPLDVIKKRFQVQGLMRHPKYGTRIEQKFYKSLPDAALQIMQTEGWAGFYKGTFPSVIKAAPSAAVTFVVYEKVSRWLGSLPLTPDSH